jgi:TonB family protein
MRQDAHEPSQAPPMAAAPAVARVAALRHPISAERPMPAGLVAAPLRRPVAASSSSLAAAASARPPASGAGTPRDAEPTATGSPSGGGGPSPRGAPGTGLETGTGDPGGGRAASSGVEYAKVLASYLSGVRARVAKHREYPYLARRANLEGTICLRLVVGASGRVLGITPTCGTSQRPLLEAALASVSSAAPFPPLPAPLGQRLTVDVPVVFALDPL